MASQRPGRTPELTLGDRLVTGFLGGILGFLTLLLFWLIVQSFGGRIENDLSLPFYWTWIGGGVTAVLGFCSARSQMMDGLGAVWNVVGQILFPRRQ